MKTLLSFFVLLFFYTGITAQYEGYNFLKLEGKTQGLEILLQRYIQIPSVSEYEKNAGKFIEAVCRDNGLHITNLGQENGNYNFAASFFPLESRKPNIIFLNHIDVVPEKDESTFGAYSGKIYEGKVYGRGAIDNKGAAVMQLGSILQAKHLLKNDDLPYNVTFLAVSCEENQCDGGVNFVVDNYFELLNPATVIGEGPSEISTVIGGEFKNPIFAISIAHKRSLWLNLSLDIHTAGHGSVTPLRYANKEMVEALDRLVSKKPKMIYNDINIGLLKTLSEHKNGLEKLVLRHPRFFKPLIAGQLRKQPEMFSLYSNTITLTNIQANNNTYNKIPSFIEAYLDCRLLPETDENEFLAEIKTLLNNDDIKIKVTESTPKTNPSKKDLIYYQKLKKAIKMNHGNAEVISIMMPNLNDLGAFRAKGIPCYATIPTYLTREQVESIHNVDENVSVNTLYDGAQVYYSFIELMLKN